LLNGRAADVVVFDHGSSLFRPFRVSSSSIQPSKVTVKCLLQEALLKGIGILFLEDGQNLLMVGPPGSGKTMLARRSPSILPNMTFDEALETTRIHSIAGMLKDDQPLLATRPFRAPHHTISDVALIGGGQTPKPGEVSLAHNGVLFLDEIPEFKRNVLEVLRQPIENGEVTVSRAVASITYPASFMLVSAMNPCPCDYLSDPRHQCTCTPGQTYRYRRRVSGPLLDRVDIHI
jgi:magnesium chelatase family protein